MSSHDESADELAVGPAGDESGGRNGFLPNYTRRRMAAVGSMIAILILVGAAGWIATRVDTSPTATLTEPAWNTIIEASRNTGELVMLDPDGAIIADALGRGLTSAVFTFEDRLGLLGPRELTLRSSDLTAEEAPLTIALEAQWGLQRLQTHRSLTFLATPSTPGNLLLIDGATGTTLDVGMVAGQRTPILFPDSLTADRNQRIFALGDGRNFQTIVVGFDLPTASYFPGVPITISSDLVITATTVGRSSELGVFSVDGQRLNSVATERPIGTLLTDRTLLMVSPTGGISTLDVDSGEITPRTPLILPIGEEIIWVAPGLDHQRLIVAGRRSLAILDPDGIVISQQIFTSDREMEPGWATWKCWPVGTVESVHGLIDLTTGGTVATVVPGGSLGPSTPTARPETTATTPRPFRSPPSDLTATEIAPTRQISVSANGCALHLAGPEGQFVLTPDTRVPVPITVNRVMLSPDALAAIMVTNDGRARLITLPAPDDLNGLLVDAVNLGFRRGILAFTNFSPEG